MGTFDVACLQKYLLLNQITVASVSFKSQNWKRNEKKLTKFVAAYDLPEIRDSITAKSLTSVIHKRKKTENILINAKMNYSAKFCMTGKTKIN